MTYKRLPNENEGGFIINQSRIVTANIGANTHKVYEKPQEGLGEVWFAKEAKIMVNYFNLMFISVNCMP